MGQNWGMESPSTLFLRKERKMVTFISFVLSFFIYMILIFGCAFVFALVSMKILNPTASVEEIFAYWKSLGEKK